MNQTRNTNIYNFLEDINQKSPIYPAHMMGLNKLDTTFMKFMKLLSEIDELDCHSGTMFRF
jgi:hypothetical protein